MKALIYFLIFILLIGGVFGYSLKTYYIDETKPSSVDISFFKKNLKFEIIEGKSPREELTLLHKKKWNLTSERIKIDLEKEEQDWQLYKKTKNWYAFIDNKWHYGFDEDLYGKKKFYLRWK